MDDKFWKLLSTATAAVTKEQFLKAVAIWNRNPRSVNQRVHSCIPLLSGKLEESFQEDLVISNLLKLTDDVSKLSTEELVQLLAHQGLKIRSGANGTLPEVFIKKLLPKSSKHFGTTFELVIQDSTAGWALYYGFPVYDRPSLVPNFPYRLHFQSHFGIEIPVSQNAADPSSTWLKSNLLPQLQKWALSDKVNAEFGTPNVGLPVTSHALICAEKFAELYQTLKIKYGQEMVKIWPECTDPAKFVYEDIAIAAYILLLWEDVKPVSYVDLGCGNGLLVHLLNSEGHNGIGVDVRSRKIWNLYPKTTKLQVHTVTPSDSDLFPEADWVIGNHSDELTPWIPVIAARSSQKCKFFVLPCCPYDFDGFKYRRKRASLSQYSDFLLYMKSVSEKCGFKTEFDKLRIPSTKRICLVGRDRFYPMEKWSEVNVGINQLIEDGCRLEVEENEPKDDPLVDNGWVSDYKPREAVERVKNCTQLEENLISEIVSLTATHLLSKRRINCDLNGKGRTWNAGGVAALKEIVSLIGSDKLKKLKKECGGLQTLLKNHHQVFLVQGGTVQLRTPILRSEVADKSRVQQKPCWFFINHPDSCFLDADECAFKH